MSVLKTQYVTTATAAIPRPIHIQLLPTKDCSLVSVGGTPLLTSTPTGTLAVDLLALPDLTAGAVAAVSADVLCSASDEASGSGDPKLLL